MLLLVLRRICQMGRHTGKAGPALRCPVVVGENGRGGGEERQQQRQEATPESGGEDDRLATRTIGACAQMQIKCH